MPSNMVVALYMSTLNFAMHPRGGRGQRFGLSWYVTVTVTAIMADGVSPAHTVRVTFWH